MRNRQKLSLPATLLTAAALGIFSIALPAAETPTTSKAANATKPAPKAAQKPPPPKNVATKRGITKKTAAKTVAARRPLARRTFTKPTYVSAAARAEANEGVLEKVANGSGIPVENASALVPFFEQLYHEQKGDAPGPVRILHYGDSHAAADELTGEMREQLQKVFGDGGPGYSLAGRPWNSYRRLDVRSSSSRGWYSDGLMGRRGNGMYGLGGVSMSATQPHESVSLTADGKEFELYYLRQAGGGSIAIFDNGERIEEISTAGETGPGYFHYETPEGPHKIEVETLDAAPVRLFGWVAEKGPGVTYETLGINGAEASTVLGWNEDVLRSNLERRNPALIVLAYGTNEAGHANLTQNAYRDQFVELIQRLRAAAPTATILVMGPPDRAVLTRSAGARTRSWVGMDGLDKIVEAQREAAIMTGSPFWDQRAKMGGKGAISEWVLAGMAQGDHVHLTGPGYRLIAGAMFRDLMSQYDVFVKARQSLAVAAPVPATPRVAPR